MTGDEALLFSIVVLADQDLDALNKTLRSASAQSVEGVEIVLVDRGRIGDRRVELASLARECSIQATVIQSGSLGRGQARNLGASHASGRYLAFLDASDAYHPDRLDAFRRADLRCGGFDWGFSGVEVIDRRGRVVAIESLHDGELRSIVRASVRPVEAIRGLARAFTLVSGANLVIDSSRFRELGGFRDLRWHAEWDLALRLLVESDPITIERPLYRYRVQRTPPGAEVATTAAAAERVEILERYARDMTLELCPGISLRQPVPDHSNLLDDPDARAVAIGAQWLVDQLRRLPWLYGPARSIARVFLRLRRRM